MKYLTDVVVTLALLSLAVWLYSFSSPRKKGPLFPGPHPLPFIGNVHQVTADYQHKTFTQWAKRYGVIVYARFFGQPVLVLHSVHAANDLMEKRGAIYSSRPPLVFLRELLGFDTNPVLLPYGDQWRMHRKWLQALLQDKNALESYRPIQEREIRRLLAALVQTPDEFASHIRRFIGAVLMDITYGHMALSLEDDQFIRLAAKASVEAAEAGNVASTLVDFFPLLKHIPTWMPGAGFKQNALRIRRELKIAETTPYKWAKEAVAAGSARPSFVSSLLDNLSTDRDLTPDDERNISGVAGALYSAGTDTSGTTLQTFILAMMLYPDICKKAQAEIDQVVGTSRLPNFSDRSSLPYLERVLLEVYRWNCPVPLGVPHFSTADHTYCDHYIPKGTIIVPNLWYMTRDANIFPDPETFRPERFKTMTVQTTDLYDPRKIVFGFGRRICPGRQLADSSVWLAMANILACFNISQSAGDFANYATFTPAFSPGAISHPEPFHCQLSIRSQEIQKILLELNLESTC
ncbi:cytochrome P450 [Laetiporus sulphureus 93-53]|uniref:Cytochrome P450 n=1 Tax=Laetiporus sulphureus 93-53 TaxID=1314785 RepID=A0A165CQ02_9APHY|nr:cytochrome P450 [Laetiporus sulphureus 93-53]KZT03209.1 cytochrome P450 [Laetiporus sulphureus 93-53]